MKRNQTLVALLYRAGPILLAASTLGCIAGNRAAVDESPPAFQSSRLPFIRENREATQPGSDQVRSVSYQEVSRASLPVSPERAALASYQTVFDGDDSPQVLKFEKRPDGTKYTIEEVMLALLTYSGQPDPSDTLEFVGRKNLPIRATIDADPIDAMLRQLEKQTGVLVGRVGDMFIVHSDVTFDKKDDRTTYTIDEVMTLMLFGLPYSYEFAGSGGDDLPITAKNIFGSSIDDRMRQLEKQTGVLIGRDGDNFIVHSTMEFNNRPLKETMDEMLKGLEPDSYKIVGREDKLINATIVAHKSDDRFLKLEDRIRQLEKDDQVLVVRRGNKFYVYSEGPRVNEKFQGEPIKEAMDKILFDRRFRIVGDENLPTWATIRAYSTDDALRQLEDQTGFRVARRGGVFVVYPTSHTLDKEYNNLLEIEELLGDKAKIKGRKNLPIAVKLRGSFDEAMQQLEDQTGLLVVKQGDVFIVYSEGAEKELQDQPITYVYKCRHAKAWDLIGIVENEAPEGFPQAGKPDIADYAGSAVTIRSHETGTVSANMPATALTSPLGATEYQIVHHLNAVILQGQYNEVRDAVDFLRMIDRPMPIVFVDLLIVQYFHEDSYAWRYNFFAGQVAKGGPFTSDAGPPPGFGSDPKATNFFGPRAEGLNFEDIALNAATGELPLSFSSVGALTGNFRQNLRHLVSENQARVVTNPHVAVINGHRGTIVQDDTFNFTLNDVATGAATTVSQTLQKLDAVTALTVTPTVIGPEKIHMAVNATLTSFVANVAGGSVTQDLPDQRQNDLATSVVLKDKQTLIIGGLVREEMLEDRDKYPFLARTPLFGHLFRGKSHNKRFVETVIYVTPHLDGPDGREDEYVKEIFDRTAKMQERGEFIRSENRLDKYRFENQYRFNEKLDHEQHKRLKRERARGEHLRHQQGPQHQHYPQVLDEAVILN